MLCEKFRKTTVSVPVKGDYLVELAAHWYRFDTNRVCTDQSIRRSPANSAATASRGRTSTARAPSTITSQGRGRLL